MARAEWSAESFEFQVFALNIRYDDFLDVLTSFDQWLGVICYMLTIWELGVADKHSFALVNGLKGQQLSSHWATHNCGDLVFVGDPYYFSPFGSLLFHDPSRPGDNTDSGVVPVDYKFRWYFFHCGDCLDIEQILFFQLFKIGYRYLCSGAFPSFTNWVSTGEIFPNEWWLSLDHSSPIENSKFQTFLFSHIWHVFELCENLHLSKISRYTVSFWVKFAACSILFIKTKGLRCGQPISGLN